MMVYGVNMFNLFNKDIKYSIYIIDDDPDISEIFEEEISAKYKNAEVVVYNDSLKALECIKALELQPSVILCDMKMPGIKGLQLRAELVANGITSPFIFISGLGGENVIDDKYTILAKPVDFELLFEHVQKHLNEL
jgi:FixJ family two-component response regulator